MSEKPSIQWFPGHMAKTRRLIKECLPLVDCVAEVIDARIPESSRNPELDELCANKPRIMLLNKADLADENATAAWLEYYKKLGYFALATDCKSGKGLNRFISMVKEILSEKLERYAAKGMVGRTLRVMVAGIPNSGKSTFINSMAGGRRAKVENRPGVTKGKQWISLEEGLEMLDTPGILWPKFEDASVGEKLALIGSVKDEILDRELLASRLLEKLAPDYAPVMISRFKLELPFVQDGFELLQLVANRRGLLIAGGEPNTERAAIMVLDEYRAGKLGRITLERP